ncbi:hypothetical protein CHK68_004564, partial [Salmonella enterica subsp. enterica serovar Chester]|nr:hypothetical protein [Salmonella enterica subsp. enterica serovar Chester]
SSHPKTVNGDAIYCVAVKRCRRSRKTRCQHVQEGGDVQMAQRMKVTYELKE